MDGVPLICINCDNIVSDGDGLNTDFMFVNTNGMDSVLTLTGCIRYEDIMMDNVSSRGVSNLTELIYQP